MTPPTRPNPIDAERPFEAGELFFSTTDAKGIIRSSNDVFVRVSGHAREVLIGAPHNIIRHPDMPRAVFALLWDAIGAGRPFAGYVKNLAADGRHYWVVALVVPVKDGYLSVRFKPGSAYFPVVRSLYAEMLEIERNAGSGFAERRDGMRLATERLGEALASRGFAGYDAFMQTILHAELASHAAATRGARPRPAAAATADARALAALLDACGQAHGTLDETFAHVDGMVTSITGLDRKTGYLLGLSSNIHLVSLNALIASCRLPRGGEGVSVVTENLAALSKDGTSTIDRMTTAMRGFTEALRDTAFNISAAKLQVDMTVFFLRELLEQAAGEADRERERRTRADIAMLVGAFTSSAAQLGSALAQARQALPELARLQGHLGGDLRRLGSVHVTGKIQAACIGHDTHVRELLEEIHGQLTTASGEVDELALGLAAMRTKLPALDGDARHLDAAIGRVNALVA